MTLYWVAQAIGCMGMILLAFAYIQKKRSAILGYNIASAITWTAHFLLLAAPAGAAMNALSIARASLLYAEEKLQKRRVVTLVFLLIAFVVAAVLTWVDSTSILPLIAMVLSTFALWQRDPQHIRLIILLSTPFWIAYNILHGSIAGVATETVIAVSAAIGLRMHAQSYAKTRQHR